MKKLLSTTAMVALMSVSVAQADEMNTLKSIAGDTISAKTTEMVEEKTAEVKKEATKKVISETAKTTANTAGITGQDELIETTVDKGVDLYDENKEKIAEVKESLKKEVSVDPETGDLVVEETVKTTVEANVVAEEIENVEDLQDAIGEVKGELSEALTEEQVITEDLAEETEILLDETVQDLEPAAGAKINVEIEEGQDLGATDALDAVEPEAGTVEVEEEKGMWETIKGYFN